MLDGLEIRIGVDLEKLVEAGTWITRQLGRRSGSKVALASSPGEFDYPRS